MGLYGRCIEPALVSLACSARPIARQRRKIVPQAEGRVLEVGFGSGLNLPYYDPEKVSSLVALEPSEGMRRRAAPRLAETPLNVELIGLRGEEIPLADDSIDTVLVTYTLCTIPDAAAALAQMRRVLKPGGRMLFSEHGLAPDASVARWQARLNGVWGAIGGGCNLNRDIAALIRAAGFAFDDLQTGYLPKTPRFAGYNYWGCAHAA